MDISVVLPLLNEEKNVPILYQRLKDVLEKMGKSYEIIFIDDGCTDNTFAVIQDLQSKNKNVKVIGFRKNFGKSAALAAGFRFATGDIIITMDGDLQDEPEEIPGFIEKIREGHDLVVGWRASRRDPLAKKVPSKIFNWSSSVLTSAGVHDFNCGFKAFRNEVIKNIEIYGELHRYIPALAHWKGYKIGELKVKHHERKYGKSKYGFSRLFKGFLDLITVKFLITFVRKPLHLFGFVGFSFLFVGVIIGIYLVYLRFVMNAGIGNRPLLIFSVLLMIVGLQFISMGLLGEMITRTYQRSEDYDIIKILGFNNE